MDLAALQSALRERGIDAWLFADFRVSDPIAYRVLGLDPKQHITRRWYYLVPADGEPVKLVHRIESGKLDSLPGAKRVYLAWEELHRHLREMATPYRKLAMQYSPANNIPYVSLVDAGTVEMIRGFGVDVQSSADLVQLFEARWSDGQLRMHLEAAAAVDQIRAAAFEEIGRRLARSGRTTEFEIQQFIVERIAAGGMVADGRPIVGVNSNSGDPHYEPTAELSAPIRPGDWILIDLWAKLNRPDAVYYDITWTGYTGPKAPEKVEKVFRIVTEARDRAVRFVQAAFREGRTIQGWQVDQVTRAYITGEGYGEYFTHRTGHSIAQDIHANGANMDNLETKDERQVVSRTCFSVEPGVYLPEFGVRSEVNVYAGEREARVTGAIQTEIVRIDF